MLRRNGRALLFEIGVKLPLAVFATNLPDDLCISCFGFVPRADGGGSRELTFAKSPENVGTAIRYALDIFLP
jgi:hypothetical protein